MTGPSRRALLAMPLASAGAGGVAAQPPPREDYAAAERAILAGRTPIADGIVLDVPQLSENGNSVDVSVKVASPMTPGDHVRAIHILSEKNPHPRVATFALSPRSGRAEVAARIRLSSTQGVTVLAETSTGRVHRASQDVIVILGACVDGG